MLFAGLIYAQNNFAVKDTIYVFELINQSENYYNSGDFKKAKEIYENILKVSDSLDYKFGLYKSYYRKGAFSYIEGKTQASIKYYQLAEKALHHIDNDKEYSKLYFSMALTYFLSASYVTSIEYSLKALDYAKDTQLNIDIYNHLATLYKAINQFDDANHALEKAYEYLLKNYFKPSRSYKFYLLLKGEVSYSLGDYDTALKFFEKSKSLLVFPEDNYFARQLYEDFIECYIKLNNLPKAATYIDKRKAMLQKSNPGVENPNTYRVFGDYFFEVKNYAKAKFNYNKSFDLLSEFEYKSTEAKLYLSLSKLNEALNNFPKAIEHLNSYNHLNDSITNSFSEKYVTLLSNKLNLAEKERLIVDQNLEIEQQQSLILKKNKNKYIYIFVVIGVIVTLFMLVLYNNNKRKLNRREFEQLKIENKLTNLTAVVEGEEKTRLKFAQELHDGINGDLSVTSYDLTSAIDMGESESVKSTLQNLVNELAKSMDDIRNISHTIAPPSLHDFDLMNSIENFCSKTTFVSGVKITFNQFGDKININKTYETAIYRIVQELVGNIVKHSKSDEAIVQINNYENHIQITIEDEGVGFDINKVVKKGLRNVFVRIEILSATLKIDSKIGEGTTIYIKIPIDSN